MCANFSCKESNSISIEIVAKRLSGRDLRGSIVNRVLLTLEGQNGGIDWNLIDPTQLFLLSAVNTTQREVVDLKCIGRGLKPRS
jgi:hypothetical protein